MKLSKIKTSIALLAVLLGGQTVAMAQEESVDTILFDTNDIYIDPLFTYIEAPDDLPTLQSRTDYIMDHFWDPFDFKKNATVDQNALNHAVAVYMESMPYASEKKVVESVKKLIGNIKNSPGLTLQFTKAAEEALFGPRALFWNDEIYISFLENLMANKKISESKKKRYEEQLALLKRTAIGAPIPTFNFISLDDKPNGFTPATEYSLVEFVLPDCSDCRYSNLKLDISGVVNDLIEDGRLAVYVVLLGDNYKAESVNLPEKWRVGHSDNALDSLDFRRIPSFYLVDGKKNIMGKNLVVDDAIRILESVSNPTARK